MKIQNRQQGRNISAIVQILSKKRQIVRGKIIIGIDPAKDKPNESLEMIFLSSVFFNKYFIKQSFCLSNSYDDF